MVLLTDEARPGPEHEDALRRLRTRHEVMVVHVADLLAAGAGPQVTADVDTGRTLPAFLRADARLANEAAMAATARRDEVQALLRRRGIEGVTMTGTDAVVDQLIDLLRRQRRVARR